MQRRLIDQLFLVLDRNYKNYEKCRHSGESRISQKGGEHQPQGWGVNLLFDQIFHKNCMKMKEIRSGGASLTSFISVNAPLPTSTTAELIFRISSIFNLMTGNKLFKKDRKFKGVYISIIRLLSTELFRYEIYCLTKIKLGAETR